MLSALAVRDAVRAAVREAEAMAKATAPVARVPAMAAVPAEITRDGVDGSRFNYVVDVVGAAVKAMGRASVGGAFKAVPLQCPLLPIEEVHEFIKRNFKLLNRDTRK